MGRRDPAILALLFHLGLRRGEVVGLDLEHLDLPGRRLSILGKGRTQREYLTLPEPTAKVLAAWLEVRGAAPGPLFLNYDHKKLGGRLSSTSLYRMVRGLGRDLGFETRPHGLRHAATTRAVQVAQEHGLGLEGAQAFSRHKSLAILQVYHDRVEDAGGEVAALVAGSM